MWGSQVNQPQYDDDIWDESQDCAPVTNYVQPTRTFEHSRDSSNRSYNTDQNKRYDRNDRGNSFGGSSRGSRQSRSDGNEGNWRGNNSTGRPSIEGQVEIEVSVDSSIVGRIIGSGGSKIRELQEESGASINIVKDGNNQDGETNIKIKGTSENCNKAKEMIEDIASSSRNSYQRGGGYGNSNQSSNQPSAHITVHDDGYEEIDWHAAYEESARIQKEKWAKLPPIIKDFYHEADEVASMTSEQVKCFRKDNNNIFVTKVDEDDVRLIPNPVTSFYQAFSQYPEILNEIKKQGFPRPSPIQAQAWPVLLKGYDLIGIAQTGTGKTLAFLLPAFIHIDSQLTPRNERVGPSCLIMAPTRELAQQIERETKKYEYRNIKCVCVYGGGSRREQMNIVARGVEIVIATPGRLNDLVMNNVINVTSVTYLVLDEADRMLDMGFEPQIKKILLDIRPDRQTIMTSATWPDSVRRLAEKYMTKPMQVFVGSLDLTATHTVSQEVVFVTEEEKRLKVFEFIRNMAPDDKIIVFCGKKVVADDVASDFALNGIECQALHGDRDQADREQALEDMKTGAVRILVATDVASRGLDIKDITHVLNMDFPRNIEEYVHRVGRTGRAGASGKAISFMTRDDWRKAQELIDIMEEAGQEVPQELYDMAERFEAWKQRKKAEEDSLGPRGGGRRGGRGFGGRGGGRRDRNLGSEFDF